MPGRKVIRALEKCGWRLVRTRGSHHLMRHPDGREVVVPVHQGRDLKRGTLRGILKEAFMTVEELTKLL
ncbi:type II toxin-antitoxin system HicA family toxin [Nocardia sp. BMG51109]|uniref:type II toxin-antitoxin system HicA family toxin n=1 Tax=Nocardia sp. BMG51109 TaxID=1056816 RepID=UPI0018DB716F